ncbi:MAG: serine/threonine-protein phosphatase [Rhodothermaceae bacterium]|nr:serine/threonine-protein phosphatase [Rhodothermaceae bacterium]
MPFVTAAPLSHRGGRAYNQDCTGYTTDQMRGCWVLADGLGGHAAGEIASCTASEAAIKAFETQPSLSSEALQAYITQAQDAVLTRQRDEPDLASMKTTLVVLVANEREARWAHVGDSRLYAFHEGRAVAQTVDHSVPEALVTAGEITRAEIREHPDRNRLLRALGKRGGIRATVSEAHPIEPGDVFLLCSDGFWEYVLEAEMELDLQATDSPDAWLAAMERRLLARVPGDHDNYSALAVFVT